MDIKQEEEDKKSCDEASWQSRFIETKSKSYLEIRPPWRAVVDLKLLLMRKPLFTYVLW